MKQIKKRLEEMEKRAPVQQTDGPVFMWHGWEMTAEKEAKILRKYPDIKMFWRLLSLTLPYGVKKRPGIIKHVEGGLLIWPAPKAEAKAKEEIRKRIEEESRLISERWRSSKERDTE